MFFRCAVYGFLGQTSAPQFFFIFFLTKVDCYGLLFRQLRLKEKKARVEDAMHTTRAAVEEGILPGGGVALLRCIPVLDELKLDDPDEQIGVDIVRRSLEEPCRQIAENAGLEGSVVVDRVKKETQNVGFDALVGEYKDLVEAGVVDAKKVMRLAIQNASSVAGLMLTTEALVADIPEEEKAPPYPPPGGDMY